MQSQQSHRYNDYEYNQDIQIINTYTWHYNKNNKSQCRGKSGHWIIAQAISTASAELVILLGRRSEGIFFI
jgi:hypothetical protein